MNEKCVQCGSKKELLKVKDETNKETFICSICFESTCEGYKLI